MHASRTRHFSPFAAAADRDIFGDLLITTTQKKTVSIAAAGRSAVQRHKIRIRTGNKRPTIIIRYGRIKRRKRTKRLDRQTVESCTCEQLQQQQSRKPAGAFSPLRRRRGRTRFGRQFYRSYAHRGRSPLQR